MRWLLACAFLSAVALASSGTAAARGATCHPPGVETLRASPLVRVYTERRAVNDSTARPLYGCVRETGHTKRLGPAVRNPNNNLTVTYFDDPIALNGYWVAAFEFEGYATDQYRYIFFSKNLVSGSSQRCNAHGAWHNLLLAPDGNMAWLQREELHVCLRSGQRALAGPVDVNSVRLTGRRLAWTESGIEHAFRL